MDRRQKADGKGGTRQAAEGKGQTTKTAFSNRRIAELLPPTAGMTTNGWSSMPLMKTVIQSRAAPHVIQPGRANSCVVVTPCWTLLTRY